MSKQTAANLRAEWRISYFASKKCEMERPVFYFGFQCLNERHMEEPPPPRPLWIQSLYLFSKERSHIQLFNGIIWAQGDLAKDPHIGEGMTEAQEGV